MPGDLLTTAQLNRATLARQLLLTRARHDPDQAIAAVGGLQAQEPKHPFVALWSRLADFQPSTVHNALHQRAVVRATAMRGTLHLMTAADYQALRPVLQQALQAGLRALGARVAGLDVEALLPAARALLASGPLPFDEIRPALQRVFPAVNERALGYAVRVLLPLIMVPTTDRWGFPANASFALADQWLGAPVELPAADEAAGADDAGRCALVRQYLAAFGPATVADVQAWSGLTAMAAVMAKMTPELVVFRDERRRQVIDLPEAPRPDPQTPAPPRLLAEFDSVLLAYQDRTRLVDEVHKRRLITANLRVPATFLCDGRVAGTWRVVVSRKEAVLTLHPFGRLPAADRDELHTEAEKLVRLIEPAATAYAVRLAEPDG